MSNGKLARLCGGDRHVGLDSNWGQHAVAAKVAAAGLSLGTANFYVFDEPEMVGQLLH
jgi:hypothetical protein